MRPTLSIRLRIAAMLAVCLLVIGRAAIAASTVSGTTSVSVNITDVSTTGLAGTSQATATINLGSTTTQWTAGSSNAAGTCDIVYSHHFTLAASPTSINLQSLAGPNGETFVCAHVRFIALRITSLDGKTLAIGAAGSNEFDGFLGNGDLFTAYPGSPYILLNAPLATAPVVDSTHRLIKVDPGANTVDVDVVILGNST